MAAQNNRQQERLMKALEDSFLSFKNAGSSGLPKKNSDSIGKILNKKEPKTKKPDQPLYTVLRGKKDKDEDYICASSKTPKVQKKETKEVSQGKRVVPASAIPYIFPSRAETVPKASSFTDFPPMKNQWTEKRATDLFSTQSPSRFHGFTDYNDDDDISLAIQESLRSAEEDEKKRLMYLQYEAKFLEMDRRQNSFEAPSKEYPPSSRNDPFYFNDAVTEKGNAHQNQAKGFYDCISSEDEWSTIPSHRSSVKSKVTTVEKKKSKKQREETYEVSATNNEDTSDEESSAVPPLHVVDKSNVKPKIKKREKNSQQTAEEKKDSARESEKKKNEANWKQKSEVKEKQDPKLSTTKGAIKKTKPEKSGPASSRQIRPESEVDIYPARVGFAPRPQRERKSASGARRKISNVKDVLHNYGVDGEEYISGDENEYFLAPIPKVTLKLQTFVGDEFIEIEDSRGPQHYNGTYGSTIKPVSLSDEETSKPTVELITLDDDPVEFALEASEAINYVTLKSHPDLFNPEKYLEYYDFPSDDEYLLSLKSLPHQILPLYSQVQGNTGLLTSIRKVKTAFQAHDSSKLENSHDVIVTENKMENICNNVSQLISSSAAVGNGPKLSGESNDENLTQTNSSLVTTDDAQSISVAKDLPKGRLRMPGSGRLKLPSVPEVPSQVQISSSASDLQVALRGINSSSLITNDQSSSLLNFSRLTSVSNSEPSDPSKFSPTLEPIIEVSKEPLVDSIGETQRTATQSSGETKVDASINRQSIRLLLEEEAQISSLVEEMSKMDVELNSTVLREEIDKRIAAVTKKLMDDPNSALFKLLQKEMAKVSSQAPGIAASPQPRCLPSVHLTNPNLVNTGSPVNSNSPNENLQSVPFNLPLGPSQTDSQNYLNSQTNISNFYPLDQNQCQSQTYNTNSILHMNSQSQPTFQSTIPTNTSVTLNSPFDLSALSQVKTVQSNAPLPNYVASTAVLDSVTQQNLLSVRSNPSENPTGTHQIYSSEMQGLSNSYQTVFSVSNESSVQKNAAPAKTVTFGGEVFESGEKKIAATSDSPNPPSSLSSETVVDILRETMEDELGETAQEVMKNADFQNLLRTLVRTIQIQGKDCRDQDSFVRSLSKEFFKHFLASQSSFQTTSPTALNHLPSQPLSSYQGQVNPMTISGPSTNYLGQGSSNHSIQGLPASGVQSSPPSTLIQGNTFPISSTSESSLSGMRLPAHLSNNFAQSSLPSPLMQSNTFSISSVGVSGLSGMRLPSHLSNSRPQNSFPSHLIQSNSLPISSTGISGLSGMQLPAHMTNNNLSSFPYAQNLLLNHAMQKTATLNNGPTNLPSSYL